MKKKLSSVINLSLNQIIFIQLCVKCCVSQNIPPLQFPNFSNNLPNLQVINPTNFPFNSPDNNVQANGLRIVTALPISDGLFSNGKNVLPHSSVFQIGNEGNNFNQAFSFSNLPASVPNLASFQFNNPPTQISPLNNFVINGMPLGNSMLNTPNIGFQNVGNNLPKARNLLTNGLAKNDIRQASGLANTESQLANLLANNGLLNTQISNGFQISSPAPIAVPDNLANSELFNSLMANLPANNIQPCCANAQLPSPLPVPNSASITPTLQNFQNILNELSSNGPVSNNLPFINNGPNSNLDCQNVLHGGLSFLANLPVNLPSGNLYENMPVGNMAGNLPLGNLLGNLPAANFQMGEVPVVNIHTEKVTKIQKPTINSNLLQNALANMKLLNLGESGFPILSGLPIIGITESVTVLNHL